jgi:hypothetical protein
VSVVRLVVREDSQGVEILFDVRVELVERWAEDSDGAVLLVGVELGIVALEVATMPVAR